MKNIERKIKCQSYLNKNKTHLPFEFMIYGYIFNRKKRKIKTLFLVYHCIQ